MKHPVFFFLLIVFCSMRGMDKYEQKASKLIKRCVLYNQYDCNAPYNIEFLEITKNSLLQLSSPVEKERILKEASLYVPHVRVANGQVFFYWKSTNGKEHSTDNRIYST